MSVDSLSPDAMKRLHARINADVHAHQVLRELD